MEFLIGGIIVATQLVCTYYLRRRLDNPAMPQPKKAEPNTDKLFGER